MKIKRDFVTNSSSTGYIALIPDGFNIVECLSILELGGVFLVGDDRGCLDLTVEELKDICDELIEKGFLEHETYMDSDSYWKLLHILEDMNLIVFAQGITNEYNSFILNLAHPKILEQYFEQADGDFYKLSALWRPGLAEYGSRENRNLELLEKYLDILPER